MYTPSEIQVKQFAESGRRKVYGGGWAPIARITLEARRRTGQYIIFVDELSSPLTDNEVALLERATQANAKATETI